MWLLGKERKSVRFDEECDLLIGNRPENDSDNQYSDCEDYYRYDICNNWFRRK